MQKGKQATRGQKQIHDENKSTVFHYSVASALTSGLYVVLNLLVFGSGGTGPWIGWTISTLIQLISIGLMFSMIKSVRNERNQIVDAGLDLNDPHAFGEYCKDLIILCSITHVLGVISSYFYYILLVVPMFALFKLWTQILGPWFFAQPYEPDENDKKQKKREKKVFIRR